MSPAQRAWVLDKTARDYCAQYPFTAASIGRREHLSQPHIVREGFLEIWRARTMFAPLLAPNPEDK